MKLFACCPVMLLADCPIQEKAPSTSYTYTYTYTHTYSDIAGQTLSNACFDRGGCCGWVGVFCLRAALAVSMQTAHDFIRACY